MGEVRWGCNGISAGKAGNFATLDMGVGFMDVETEATMNTHLTPKTILTAIFAAATLTVTITEANAQRPRVKKKAKRAEMHANGIDAGALGAVKGQFEAWKRTVLGGGDYYTSKDRDLRSTHAGMYAKLRTAALEDRLSDAQFRELVGGLLEIGKKAKGLRGDAEGLSVGDKATVSAQLRDLGKRAKESAANEISRKALTPKVNRMQISVEEVFRFGVDDELLSAGQQASLRRKYESLEKKEAAAKKDEEMSEQERENLWEDAVENGRDTAEILQR